MPVQNVPTPPPQTELPPAHRGKLGRLKDPVDRRDFDFRALREQAQRLTVPVARQRSRTYLPPRKPENQGQISKCVLTTVLHRYLAAPNEHRGAYPFDTTAAYHVCQAEDEWAGGERAPARRPGEPYYEGTSLRAALELFRRGYDYRTDGQFPGYPDLVLPKIVHSYWRLNRWDDVLDYTLAAVYGLGGSACWGQDWSRSMFRADAGGYLEYDARDVVGGHATMQYHASEPKREFGWQNNWGTDRAASGMGVMGRYKMRWDGPRGARALFEAGADVWAVVELGTPLAAVAQTAVEQGGLT